MKIMNSGCLYYGGNLKILYIISLSSFLIIALLSGACGSDDPYLRSTGDMQEIELYAEKDVYVRVSYPEVYSDSIQHSSGKISSVILEIESEDMVILRAMLVPGCGSTESDMCEYLLQRDISAKVDTGTNRAFTAITYQSGDSCVVERIWAHGSRELIVLQAKKYGNSPTVLLDDVRLLFNSAQPVFEPEYSNRAELITPRNVYPADRLYDRISEDIQQSGTTVPSILHSMVINVNPGEQSVTIIDTLTVDFSPTESDFKLSFYLSEDYMDAEISDICGNSEIDDDSLVCISDSTGVFRGIFEQVFEGTELHTGEDFVLSGYQVRSSSSFQCGMWFYPGCRYPADYIVEITIPDTAYTAYVPMDDLSYGGSTGSGRNTVRYASPVGGLKGPIAWAVSDFDSVGISSGRSGLYLSDTIDPDDDLKSITEGLADNLWDALQYEGAKLDFVIIESLDTSIYMLGPGCVFASKDVLCRIADCSWWSDSLSKGVAVRETLIPAGAAAVFLSRSKYLDETFRQMLTGWTVYRYASNRNAENGDIMLDAFLKYYLYETEIRGGVEYALADPLLPSSEIAEPVIMGKGPLVLEFLSNEINGFVNNGLRTMLGRQRHRGDSWTRLASALNLSSSSRRRTLFRSWLFQPGIPCIRVTWANPDGQTLTLKIEQLQPGHAFPYGSVIDEIMIYTREGSDQIHLREGSRRNIYVGTVTPGIEIISIDINPDRILPADIVYRKVLLEDI